MRDIGIKGCDKEHWGRYEVNQKRNSENKLNLLAFAKSKPAPRVVMETCFICGEEFPRGDKSCSFKDS